MKRKAIKETLYHQYFCFSFDDRRQLQIAIKCYFSDRLPKITADWFQNDIFYTNFVWIQVVLCDVLCVFKYTQQFLSPLCYLCNLNDNTNLQMSVYHVECTNVQQCKSVILKMIHLVYKCSY